MIYHYSSLSGEQDAKLRVYPLVPAIFIYKHQVINRSIYCLLDSGAENCYCLKAIGDYLRIDFRRKKSVISTAANNSKFSGFVKPVHLLVNSKKIEVPFIFSDQLDPDFPVILGQKGFFSNFEVCFNKIKNEFSLS